MKVFLTKSFFIIILTLVYCTAVTWYHMPEYKRSIIDAAYILMLLLMIILDEK